MYPILKTHIILIHSTPQGAFTTTFLSTAAASTHKSNEGKLNRFPDHVQYETLYMKDLGLYGSNGFNGAHTYKRMVNLLISCAVWDSHTANSPPTSSQGTGEGDTHTERGDSNNNNKNDKNDKNDKSDKADFTTDPANMLSIGGIGTGCAEYLSCEHAKRSMRYYLPIIQIFYEKTVEKVAKKKGKKHAAVKVNK